VLNAAFNQRLAGVLAVQGDNVALPRASLALRAVQAHSKAPRTHLTNAKTD